MKIISSKVDLENGRITIDGRDVFGDLIVPAELQEVGRQQESATKSLPEEDTKPGYVIPANIVTVSGSA